MNTELSVKLNIAGRLYPMTVTMEKEGYVRTAAKEINKQVQTYKGLGIQDSQDALAMVCFDLSMHKLRDEEWTKACDQETEMQLKDCITKLDQIFQLG